MDKETQIVCRKTVLFSLKFRIHHRSGVKIGDAITHKNEVLFLCL